MNKEQWTFCLFKIFNNLSKNWLRILKLVIFDFNHFVGFNFIFVKCAYFLKYKTCICLSSQTNCFVTTYAIKNFNFKCLETWVLLDFLFQVVELIFHKKFKWSFEANFNWKMLRCSLFNRKHLAVLKHHFLLSCIVLCIYFFVF